MREVRVLSALKGVWIMACREGSVVTQGTTEALILDEGRVNKFNKRFATMGAYGKVAPSSEGGDKKLDYKVGKDDKKGKKGKGKR